MNALGADTNDGNGNKLSRGFAKGIADRREGLTNLRRFGVTVSIPLALLAAFGTWRGHTVVPALLGVLAAALGGLSVFAPSLLGPVQTVWMQVAHALGWFNTRVLLGIVYFLVMTPIGIVMRLLGRDPLDRRVGDRASYWVERRRAGDPRASMERRF